MTLIKGVMWMTVPQIRDYRGKRVHMIGIGGSSMSGLARMLLADGCLLSGSDNLETYATKALREQGVPVTIGHRAENVHGAELVVYTIAILPDNPERVEAERLGLPTLERAILLGQLMDGYPTAIGVCGTHGKTSTTSMLAQVLVETGADPTVHIGGTLDYIGGNTRIGMGDVFLTEACEFNGSFLHLRPTVAVLTNIDEDHLDYYKDIDDIQNAFGRFLALLPAEGCAVGNGDDERVLALLGMLRCRVVTFGRGEICDWRPLNLRYDPEGYASFDAALRGVVQGHVTLKVAGFFHVDNALAALACACAQGAEPAGACAAISDFTGAHRRFELTGFIDGVKLYHDYGHNPAEMRNVLSVARLQPHNRLWAVMQPHTYSRVKRLFKDYLTCTRDADITLVTDIYAAREKDPGDIHAAQIVAGMRENGVEAVHTPTFEDTERYLRAHWQPGDLVLTMGCGNIDQLNEQMNEHEAQRAAHVARG
ncbi:MAG: UDP-N-acetylmuramate--L-alanine ligase [Eubacteriales bacterium]|nr:UDP-N-acetylmuramate--L-alanine ligase [Eubacteriales bacterium]